MEAYEWGVDSAQHVTEDLFQCVALTFGYPVFWGRYLVRVPRVSEGLTKQEISLIHSKGVRILPIYNDFREARGYLQGAAAANDAVYHAGRLGIPKGILLFANIEKFFPVDAEWIQGWTEGIHASGYYSGIYHDPVTGGFQEAFCNGAKENERVITYTVLWSAQPETEPSGPWNLPSFQPQSPDCGGNVWLWQYSRRITRCPVDFNLAIRGVTNMLW
jgi:hypothetical protein